VTLAWADSRYPAWLRVVPDPPPVLWIRGDLSAFEQLSVAIVGSRAASQYARSVARRLAAGLAQAGVVVTSGMARGVDGAAHEGCLDAGGRTIAVVGTGADVVYPAEHDELAGRIVRQGLIVSECPPGTPARAWHFPRRNRIISGLSQAVVVVEASEKSGSLITARTALEQGREVMAVPGSVLYGRNRGAHALIKDGATPIEEASDILDALGRAGWTPRGVQRCADAGNDRHPVTEVLAGAGPDGLDVEGLEGATGLARGALLAELTALELEGRVVRLTGGRFLKTEH